eukprot:GFUD01017223.1.p1 GENE.GFUD01017223.1~~GFUD01017223.1.p1  ORF type:complete len:367 (-),score=92.28 GFUD01017223.1:416-1516(-)
MKPCLQYLLLLLTSVSCAPASSPCCYEKQVGHVNYILVSVHATSMYGCMDGCVYKAEEDHGKRFCFTSGSEPVTCLDGAHHPFHWCYEGACGPDHWGEEYPACDGMSQSPINIVTGSAAQSSADPITFGNYDQIRMRQLGNTGEHYGAVKESRLTNGSIKNNGHTAQLDVIATLPGDVGVLSGGPLDGDYQILQLHFHWGSNDTQGSEHTLDGNSFPMEMHIVHKKVGEMDFLNVPGGLAVTGFFFEVDAVNNSAIEPLVSVLQNIMQPDQFYDMSGSTFRITDLISGVAPLNNTDPTLYSSYSGSLTTPGCMEIVNWINFIKPIKISSEQLAMFRALEDGDHNDIVDNFRPPQPLNGRNVVFYQQ